ncbi:amino acid adenylation domain-containing protein [Actinomadura graeca]|uniref:Amino acid adenylation domain-containing protein n=1 Tax=Actinomadura graeca TaxID=2750812 RepID=A0ABX8QSX4_9ACTN|nr:amino acid adenylation domain-containing protein [Actinomadura graeca]QXJ21811.1 amino acid adenylation domain-containing protein [Actinomadura graeca]
MPREPHEIVRDSESLADRPSSLYAAFSIVAMSRPHNVAVCEEGRELTYRELDAAAGELADRLKHAAPGPYVGLALRPSIELIVAILAVLRVGKAYVPLDPGGPPDRIDRILSQFMSLPVLAEDDLAGRLAAAQSARVLRLPEVTEGATPWPAQPPADLFPETSAYVIFTSGSTGVPKGVVVSHHNVMRLFHACEEHMSFNPQDVWCLFHSPAFDFSVWEIFGALLNGGRLEMVPSSTRKNPSDFAEFLCTRGVTVLNQTPSAFRQLCAVITTDHAPRLALRKVIFGGERLDPGTLRPWYDLMGEQVELVNMYGITETTVHATFVKLSPRDAMTAGRSVIGRPLSDLRVRVVDERLRPVPPGTPGELLVSGAGLALGYLGDPDLTAARFREDLEPGCRWYRSGDQVISSEDGRLTYLGRLDRQVALNGYRIELGEVETALRGLPGVLDCHVLLDTVPAAPRLVAYLVQREPMPTQQIRTALRNDVPAYMIPTVYVPLSELPLTLNGKVDEKDLLSRLSR